MNASKVESPRLSEQEKLPCASNKFQCSFCDSNYSLKTSLYHHVKQKHEENYNNWKSSPRKGNWKFSSRNVSANSFQCPYCDSKYFQKRNLHTHVKKKHEENDGNRKCSSNMVSADSFQCAFCNSNYSQKCYLNTHVMKKHQENYENWKSSSRNVSAKSFQCPYCDSNYS